MRKRKKGWIDIIWLFLVMTLSLALTGEVARYLWNNIIAQLFDMPTLTSIQALGLCLVVDFFIYKSPTKEQQERKEMDTLIHAISANLFFLIAGWIVIHFI